MWSPLLPALKRREPAEEIHVSHALRMCRMSLTSALVQSKAVTSVTLEMGYVIHGSGVGMLAGVLVELGSRCATE